MSINKVYCLEDTSLFLVGICKNSKEFLQIKKSFSIYYAQDLFPNTLLEKMVKNVRIELKKEIEELITNINDSRNESPEPVLKYLRKILLTTKREIFTIAKYELKDRLEYVFLRLGNIYSR